MIISREREKTMNLADGKQWPIAIVTGIILIIIACGVTIYVSFLQPLHEDRDLMLDYHTLDANVNKLILAEIAFNKKYTLTYIGEGVSLEGSTIAYKIEDINGKPVNDADLHLSIVRPIVNAANITFDKPRIENGNYYFDDVKVPEIGRWSILVRVSVGDDYRHMNLKSDTMDKYIYEYGFDKPMRNYVANGGRSI